MNKTLEMTLADFNAKLSSFEAEQSVIGSILIDNPSYRKISMVRTEHFYAKHHQVIWEESTRMIKNNQPVDLVTLSDALESVGQLENVGGLAYLADLAKNTPSSANVSAYASIVLDRAYRRYLVRAHRHSLKSLLDFEVVPDTHAANSIEMINNIRSTGENSSSARHISELCEDWTKELEGRFEQGGAGGLTTGFEDLDKLLYPKNVVDGALFVVGARPKMGKTAFALKLVDHITALNHCGLVFSMEMSDTQLVERSLVQMGNVSTKTMYPTQGTFDAPDEELGKLLHTLGNLRDRDLYISTKAAIGLHEMERTIRDHHARSNGRLKAVWVDYLTLMDIETTDHRHDLGYAAITRRLKVLAKELNLVVFLLIQLNRGLENRADKRPMPSDGRETGQIEQDCDYWLGIYRDHVYNETSDRSLSELLLRLNRHGDTGKVYAKFAGGRFDDWSGPLPTSPGGGKASFNL